MVSMLSASLPFASEGATFSFHSDASQPSSAVELIIDGEIREGDVETFVQSVQWAYANERELRGVILNSIGGDMNVAIRIGRMIRALRLSTSMRDGDSCLSSCALIYISGYPRMAFGGQLGLHRPYMGGPPSISAPSRESILGMYSQMADHMRAMGLSEALIEVSLRTEPEEMFMIAGRSAIWEAIPTLDPVGEELSVWWRAQTYGLSMQEYRRLRQ